MSTVHYLFPKDGSTPRVRYVVVQWRKLWWSVETYAETGGRRTILRTKWTQRALDTAAQYAERFGARAVLLEDLYK